MSPQEPMPTPAPSLSDTDYKRLWEQMVLFVDLYKHHFDLFVKGFVVHLAIIGSGAGLAFSDKLDPFTRRWLLILVVALSIVSVVAWIVSLRWAYRFAQQFEDLCDRIGMERLPTFGVKAIIALATTGSLFFAVVGIVLLALGSPQKH